MTSLTRAVNSLLAAVSSWCCEEAAAANGTETEQETEQLEEVEEHDHTAAANCTETEELQEVEEHDHTFRGAPQDGFGPELWGITLEQLEEIHGAVPRYYTMRDVVEHFVKPKTARTGTGYAPKLFLTLS